MVEAGQACGRYMTDAIRGVPVNDVEADEIWGFVHCKRRTAERRGYGDEVGDAWTYVAMERTTKLVLCHHVGKRDSDNTWQFAWKLETATAGKFQLTTDGFRPYRSAMSDTFEGRATFAQLVKVYATTPDGAGPEARYSPGQVIDTYRGGSFRPAQQETNLHQPCRAAEPQHAYDHPPTDPANERA